ncbi:MAG: hypothetical protein ACJASX_002503 [Limisphaerales bacterium]|jgi:hypothetical protein
MKSVRMPHPLSKANCVNAFPPLVLPNEVSLIDALEFIFSISLTPTFQLEKIRPRLALESPGGMHLTRRHLPDA